jgi:opacity protein-like surface antigen
MKKKAIPVITAVFLILAAANAFSQVGLYIGAYGGISSQTPSFQNVQFDTNTKFVYGLRGGLRILMLALEVNYFTVSHNINQLGNFLLFNWKDKVNDYSYLGLNLKWVFSLAIFHPYLTVGYGSYSVDIKDPALPLPIGSDKSGGYNLGAGLEIQFGKFALVAEGKYHNVTVDITNIHLGLGDFTLCAGLNFYF